MNLSKTFSMVNPWRYEEELLTSDVETFMQAVDDQLYKLVYAPRFYVSNVEIVGAFYVIRFCLEEFKENPFRLIWGDTVSRNDMHEFIKLSYGPEDPEAYFLINILEVSRHWIESNPIE